MLSQPARMSVGSRMSQQTRPIEVVGVLTQITQQQYADAIQCENMALREKEYLRDEAVRREQFTVQEAAREKKACVLRPLM